MSTDRLPELQVTDLEQAARDAMEILGGMPAGEIGWNASKSVGHNIGHVWSRLKVEFDKIDDARANEREIRGKPNDIPF